MVTNLICIFLKVFIFLYKVDVARFLSWFRTSSLRRSSFTFPAKHTGNGPLTHSPYRFKNRVFPSLQRGVANPEAWCLQRLGCRPVFICADGLSKGRWLFPDQLVALASVHEQPINRSPVSQSDTLSIIICHSHTGHSVKRLPLAVSKSGEKSNRIDSCKVY